MAIDNEAAQELILFADNDELLYRSQYLLIVKNFSKKKQKGVFDSELARKGFMYFVDAAAKSNDKWFEMFNKETREDVAAHYVAKFEEQYVDKEYDFMEHEGSIRNAEAKSDNELVYQAGWDFAEFAISNLQEGDPNFEGYDRPAPEGSDIPSDDYTFLERDMGVENPDSGIYWRGYKDYLEENGLLKESSFKEFQKAAKKMRRNFNSAKEYKMWLEAKSLIKEAKGENWEEELSMGRDADLSYIVNYAPEPFKGRAWEMIVELEDEEFLRDLALYGPDPYKNKAKKVLKDLDMEVPVEDIKDKPRIPSSERSEAEEKMIEKISTPKERARILEEIDGSINEIISLDNRVPNVGSLIHELANVLSDPDEEGSYEAYATVIEDLIFENYDVDKV